MRAWSGICLATFFLAATASTIAAPESVADAAKAGDLDKVSTLLEQGADANAAHGDGMTALHWAARSGDASLARVLVDAGAERECRDPHRRAYTASCRGQGRTCGRRRGASGGWERRQRPDDDGHDTASLRRRVRQHRVRSCSDRQGRGARRERAAMGPDAFDVRLCRGTDGDCGRARRARSGCVDRGAGGRRRGPPQGRPSRTAGTKPQSGSAAGDGELGSTRGLEDGGEKSPRA